MSDLPDPNNKPTSQSTVEPEPIIQSEPIPELTLAPEPTSEPVSETQLPPYRQVDSSSPVTKLPVWLLPVLLAVLIGGVFLGKYWGNSEVSTDQKAATNTQTDAVSSAGINDEAEQAVLSVETVMPSQDNIGNTLSSDGTISAKDTANVSAKVSGVAIEQVLVEEGQRVKAGQVLAIFDTDAVQQQILQAEADEAEAQATLANAKADAARVLPLIDIDAISRQEADRYRTSELRAQAALQSARARLSSQRLSLSNATVTAPVSGIISEKLIEVGQVAGGEPLFTIIKNGTLEWQADIDPKLIGEVKVGTPVKVSLPQGQSVMGEVRRIAPTASDNRQITIYASLANNSNARAGMYQTGEFLLGSVSMQTVPNSAIISNDGYDYVMLVTDIKTTNDKTVGRVKRERVMLGDRFGENVAIAEPLPVESRLVKQGGSFLNEGDLVRVVDPSRATPNNTATTNTAAKQATL